MRITLEKLQLSMRSVKIMVSSLATNIVRNLEFVKWHHFSQLSFHLIVLEVYPRLCAGACSHGEVSCELNGVHCVLVWTVPLGAGQPA